MTCLKCRYLTWRLIIFPLFISILFSSCGKIAIPPLAAITGVEPQAIEPGDTLKISGNGFVEGAVEIAFLGTIKPAGLARPDDCAIHLPGTAVSSELVELAITPRIIEQFSALPGRFEGRIEIDFQTAPLSAVRIAAQSSPLTLLLNPTGSSIALTAGRMREGMHFLKSVGIALRDSLRGDDLIVGDVEDGSSAELAGIDVGDRILAVDGMPLSSVDELAGAPVQANHHFAIVTGGGMMRDLDLATVNAMNLDSDELTAFVLSSIALGFFLAFAAPARGRGSRSRDPRAHPVVKTIGLVIVAVIILAWTAVAILTSAGFGAFIFLIALQVLGWANLILFCKMKGVRRIVAFGAHLLPAPLAITLASVSGPTIGLTDIVASQQATAWGWHVWSSPFSLGAVISCLALIWPRTDHLAGTDQRLAELLPWVVAVPSAIILTATCLGGWTLPGVAIEAIPESSFLFALSCLLFLGKALGVLLVARRLAAVDLAERRARGSRFSGALGIGAPLVMLFASIAWLVSDLPAAFRAAGCVLAMIAFIAFFTASVALALKEMIAPFAEGYLTPSSS